MDNSTELRQALEADTARLLEMLETFPAEYFNTSPAENSWSAAQVAGHMLMLDKAILRILLRPVAVTERDPAEKAEEIRWVFSGERKLNAPDFILPGPEPGKQEELIASFRETRNKMMEIAGNQDLAMLCTGFKHHYFGEMTRMEWIHFCIWHTERHLRQMERVSKVLGAAS